jgi:hypothetical protein
VKCECRVKSVIAWRLPCHLTSTYPDSPDLCLPMVTKPIPNSILRVLEEFPIHLIISSLLAHQIPALRSMPWDFHRSTPPIKLYNITRCRSLARIQLRHTVAIFLNDRCSRGSDNCATAKRCCELRFVWCNG